jgi:hypothetical protein
MNFGVSSGTKMTISSAGNVGIGLGSASPTQKLHVTGDVVIDKTNNGYSGLRIHDSSSGDYISYIDLGRNQNGTRLAIRNGGRVQGTTPWTNSTGNTICSFARGGIAFGSDTASANTLDDYEEGTWSMAVIGASGSAGAWAMAASSIPIGQYNATNYVPQVQKGTTHLNIRKNQYGDYTAIYNEQTLNIRYNISGTYNIA